MERSLKRRPLRGVIKFETSNRKKRPRSRCIDRGSRARPPKCIILERREREWNTNYAVFSSPSLSFAIFFGDTSATGAITPSRVDFSRGFAADGEARLKLSPIDSACNSSQPIKGVSETSFPGTFFHSPCIILSPRFESIVSISKGAIHAISPPDARWLRLFRDPGEERNFFLSFPFVSFSLSLLFSIQVFQSWIFADRIGERLWIISFDKKLRASVFLLFFSFFFFFCRLIIRDLREAIFPDA